MKKSFISLGLIVAATFALTNCAKEFENPSQQPESAGIPFEITASTPDTKTANDGFNTVWVADDAVNVFHAEKGSSTYESDGEFTLTSGTSFTGTISEELTADEYDWYVYYPYSNDNDTPAGTSSQNLIAQSSSGSQQQNGYDNMAHLSGNRFPMYGKATVAKDGDVNVSMNHLVAVAEITVTNANTDPLLVTDVTFTSEQNIVGTFYVDFTGNEPDFAEGDNVSKTASLTVSNGTEIAKDGTAKFYIAFKPFTATSGQKLTIAVNGYSKDITLPADVEFKAGKIKTLNFAYDKAPALTLPWFEDFSSKDLSKYVITSSRSDADDKSTTKIYDTNDALAGGSLPELLVARNDGSLTATFNTDGFAGELTLSFKSNHADYITVTATSGVTVEKVVDNEYTLTVPENVASFSVTLKNSNESNTRIDDIEIAKTRLVQTLSFETEMYELETDSDGFNSFTGQTVSGNETTVTYSSSNEGVAKVDSNTGAVTLTGETGTAVITAVAEQTSEYRSAVAKYTIKVVKLDAVVTTKTVTYSFGEDAEVGFSGWTKSTYLEHVANYEDATVTFVSATQQTGTITDCPVTKGKDVTIVMGDNRTLKSFVLTLKQWTSKSQIVTLHYSKDGGSTYTETSTTSSNFALSAEVPEGTNAIKFTFSSGSNQVGVVSCKLTFDHAE